MSQPDETGTETPGADAAPPPAAETAAPHVDAAAEAPSAEPSGDVDPMPVIDPHAELRAKLEEAQGRLRAVSKAYSDLQKEMQAFRDRMEARAKAESELQAFDQARRFFDPVMNLKRSLTQPVQDLETMKAGMAMVQRQFMEAMEKLGLEEVPGEGASFDPKVHEALAVTPVADASLDGKVLMVHTVGYTVRGKVLQAAQVVIGKLEESAGEA